MAGPRLERGSSCVGGGLEGSFWIEGLGGDGEGLGVRLGEISWRGAVWGRGVLVDAAGILGDPGVIVVFESSPNDVSVKEVVLLWRFLLEDDLAKSLVLLIVSM